MRFNEYQYVVNALDKRHFGINKNKDGEIVLCVPSEVPNATNYPVRLTLDQAECLVYRLIQQIREVKHNE